MESIYDKLAQETYVAADDPVKFTLQEKFAYNFFFILDILKCFALSVPVIVMCFVKLFVITKPKCIKGQVILVTGGGNGLGKVLSLRLAREGCKLAIVDINGNSARNVAEEINKINKDAAFAYQADVAENSAVESLKADVERDLGHVDILINNAGILAMHSLLEGGTGDIQKILDVNLASHFWMIRNFLPPMLKRRRGHVVGIASIASFETVGRACAYTATKHGVKGLMAALEHELRLEGQNDIKVTTVCPYFIATRKEMIDNVKIRVPALSVEAAAKIIISGILRNETIMTVPRREYYLLKFINIFPLAMKQIFIDNLYDIAITPRQQHVDELAKRFSTNLDEVESTKL